MTKNNRKDMAMKLFTNISLAALLCVAVPTFVACNGDDPTGDPTVPRAHLPVAPPETCTPLPEDESCQPIIDEWESAVCPGGDSTPNLKLELTLDELSETDESGHQVGDIITVDLDEDEDGNWIFEDPAILGKFSFRAINIPENHIVTPETGTLEIKDVVMADGSEPNTKHFRLDIDEAYLAQLRTECVDIDIPDPIDPTQGDVGNFCIECLDNDENFVEGCEYYVQGQLMVTDEDSTPHEDCRGLWVENYPVGSGSYDIRAHVIIDSVTYTSSGTLDITPNIDFPDWDETPFTYEPLFLLEKEHGTFCRTSNSVKLGTNKLEEDLSGSFGQYDNGICVPYADDSALDDVEITLNDECDTDDMMLVTDADFGLSLVDPITLELVDPSVLTDEECSFEATDGTTTRIIAVEIEDAPIF